VALRLDVLLVHVHGLLAAPALLCASETKTLGAVPVKSGSERTLWISTMSVLPREVPTALGRSL
jgi:hypothetical protein